MCCMAATASWTFKISKTACTDLTRISPLPLNQMSTCTVCLDFLKDSCWVTVDNCVDIIRQHPNRHRHIQHIIRCFIYKSKMSRNVNSFQLPSQTSSMHADAAQFWRDNSAICIIDCTSNLQNRVQTEEKSKQTDDDICSGERIVSCLRD